MDPDLGRCGTEGREFESLRARSQKPCYLIDFADVDGALSKPVGYHRGTNGVIDAVMREPGPRPKAHVAPHTDQRQRALPLSAPDDHPVGDTRLCAFSRAALARAALAEAPHARDR